MTKDYKFTWAGLLFVLVHLICFTALYVGVTWSALALCFFMFVLRKFGITGGFHRYFSHRSYRTSRFFQFFLAFIGGMSAQKGALWWAAHHRHHHKHSDTEEDLHSAKLEGFMWSHVGWVLSNEYDEYDSKAVTDLTKFPELLFLDKYHFIPPVTCAVACYLIGGWMGLIWGFFISTVILYHTTFAINSLCHMFGKQRYETGEASKNSLWLAIVTMGEGWHNNHHHYQLSARQGFFWWEVDVTFYILLTLNKLGIIWDIKYPPAKLLKPDAMIPEARAAFETRNAVARVQA
ncbi:MAG: acyl-CoA desaturase [Candidatus Methylacidiphilales bacterium]|nr:acyl-CoA desaturase [Candidatus Methylacidiphilales bacterium]